MEFNFIYEELSDLAIESKPMFGARGVYYDGKIVFILRDRPSSPQDNGMWLATTPEHHASLQLDFPEMRSIELFGGDSPTGWQNIPLESESFEESALRVCQFVRARDPRIGKIPKKSIRRKKKTAKKALPKSGTWKAKRLAADAKNAKNAKKKTTKKAKKLGTKTVKRPKQF